ncbi:hypothetical protein PoB_002035500 [Plakobranchus ocellatus]|uniref:Uncharacterized protein n=1 Tax=Plakobranchus ocellatus TaxID=259542 RepID=A0AAV3ZH10_9GAST|nr:hypothetical protein PoB_002035500 [Plakobranchus ocellatus]
MSMNNEVASSLANVGNEMNSHALPFEAEDENSNKNVKSANEVSSADDENVQNEDVDETTSDRQEERNANYLDNSVDDPTSDVDGKAVNGNVDNGDSDDDDDENREEEQQQDSTHPNGNENIDRSSTSSSTMTATQGTSVARTSSSRGYVRVAGRPQGPHRPPVMDTGLADDFVDGAEEEIFFFASAQAASEMVPDLNPGDLLLQASQSGIQALFNPPGSENQQESAPAELASAPLLDDGEILNLTSSEEASPVGINTPQASSTAHPTAPQLDPHLRLNRNDTRPQGTHEVNNQENRAAVDNTSAGSSHRESEESSQSLVDFDPHLRVIGATIGVETAYRQHHLPHLTNHNDMSATSCQAPPTQPTTNMGVFVNNDDEMARVDNNKQETSFSFTKLVKRNSDGSFIADDDWDLEQESLDPSPEDQSKIDAAETTENFEASEDVENGQVASAENDFLSLEVRRNSSSPVIDHRKRTEEDADALLNQIITGRKEKGMGPNAKMPASGCSKTADLTTCVLQPNVRKSAGENHRGSDSFSNDEQLDTGCLNDYKAKKRKVGGCNVSFSASSSKMLENSCYDTTEDEIPDETSHGISDIHTLSVSHETSQGILIDSLLDTSARICSTSEDDTCTDQNHRESYLQNVHGKDMEECGNCAATDYDLYTSNRDNSEQIQNEDMFYNANSNLLKHSSTSGGCSTQIQWEADEAIVKTSNCEKDLETNIRGSSSDNSMSTNSEKTCDKQRDNFGDATLKTFCKNISLPASRNIIDYTHHGAHEERSHENLVFTNKNETDGLMSSSEINESFDKLNTISSSDPQESHPIEKFSHLFENDIGACQSSGCKDQVLADSPNKQNSLPTEVAESGASKTLNPGFSVKSDSEQGALESCYGNIDSNQSLLGSNNVHLECSEDCKQQPSSVKSTYENNNIIGSNETNDSIEDKIASSLVKPEITMPTRDSQNNTLQVEVAPALNPAGAMIEESPGELCTDNKSHAETKTPDSPNKINLDMQPDQIVGSSGDQSMENVTTKDSEHHTSHLKESAHGRLHENSACEAEVKLSPPRSVKCDQKRGARPMSKNVSLTKCNEHSAVLVNDLQNTYTDGESTNKNDLKSCISGTAASDGSAENIVCKESRNCVCEDFFHENTHSSPAPKIETDNHDVNLTKSETPQVEVSVNCTMNMVNEKLIQNSYNNFNESEINLPVVKSEGDESIFNCRNENSDTGCTDNNGVKGKFQSEREDFTADHDLNEMDNSCQSTRENSAVNECTPPLDQCNELEKDFTDIDGTNMMRHDGSAAEHDILDKNGEETNGIDLPKTLLGGEDQCCSGHIDEDHLEAKVECMCVNENKIESAHNHLLGVKQNLCNFDMNRSFGGESPNLQNNNDITNFDTRGKETGEICVHRNDVEKDNGWEQSDDRKSSSTSKDLSETKNDFIDQNEVQISEKLGRDFTTNHLLQTNTCREVNENNVHELKHASISPDMVHNGSIGENDMDMNKKDTLETFGRDNACAQDHAVEKYRSENESPANSRECKFMESASCDTLTNAGITPVSDKESNAQDENRPVSCCESVKIQSREHVALEDGDHLSNLEVKEDRPEACDSIIDARSSVEESSKRNGSGFPKDVDKNKSEAKDEYYNEESLGLECFSEHGVDFIVQEKQNTQCSEKNVNVITSMQNDQALNNDSGSKCENTGNPVEISQFLGVKPEREKEGNINQDNGRLLEKDEPVFLNRRHSLTSISLDSVNKEDADELEEEKPCSCTEVTDDNIDTVGSIENKSFRDDLTSSSLEDYNEREDETAKVNVISKEKLEDADEEQSEKEKTRNIGSHESDHKDTRGRISSSHEDEFDVREDLNYPSSSPDLELECDNAEEPCQSSENIRGPLMPSDIEEQKADEGDELLSSKLSSVNAEIYSPCHNTRKEPRCEEDMKPEALHHLSLHENIHDSLNEKLDHKAKTENREHIPRNESDCCHLQDHSSAEKVILEATDMWLQKISDFCQSSTILSDSRSDAKIHQFTAECKSQIVSISKCKVGGSASMHGPDNSDSKQNISNPRQKDKELSVLNSRNTSNLQQKSPQAKLAFVSTPRHKNIRPSSRIPLSKANDKSDYHNNPKESREFRPPKRVQVLHPHPPKEDPPTRKANQHTDGEMAVAVATQLRRPVSNKGEGCGDVCRHDICSNDTAAAKIYNENCAELTSHSEGGSETTTDCMVHNQPTSNRSSANRLRRRLRIDANVADYEEPCKSSPQRPHSEKPEKSQVETEQAKLQEDGKEAGDAKPDPSGQTKTAWPWNRQILRRQGRVRATVDAAATGQSKKDNPTCQILTVKEFEKEQLMRHLNLDFRRINKTGPSVDCHMDAYVMKKAKASVEKQRAKNNYSSLLALENNKFLHVLRYTKSVYHGNFQKTGQSQPASNKSKALSQHGNQPHNAPPVPLGSSTSNVTETTINSIFGTSRRAEAGDHVVPWASTIRDRLGAKPKTYAQVNVCLINL